MNKTILITGANRGIGLETAFQIAKRDCHVIISGRNKPALESALERLQSVNRQSEMLVMDVNDQNSIANARDSIISKNIKLDVLINNAAVLFHTDTSLIENEISIFENTIHTNFLAPLMVIKAFLPVLNLPGKIINISSSGGSLSDPIGGWSPAYCVSKTGLNAITRHLANELKYKNISVNAIDPGWTQTEMGGIAAPRSVEKAAETIVWLSLEADQNLTGKFYRDKNEIPW